MEMIFLLSQIVLLVCIVMTVAVGIWGMLAFRKLTDARHALEYCANTDEEKEIRTIGGHLKREFKEARFLFFVCADVAIGMAIFLVRTKGTVW